MLSNNAAQSPYSDIYMLSNLALYTVHKHLKPKYSDKLLYKIIHTHAYLEGALIYQIKFSALKQHQGAKCKSICRGTELKGTLYC